MPLEDVIQKGIDNALNTLKAEPESDLVQKSEDKSEIKTEKNKEDQVIEVLSQISILHDRLSGLILV